ncbi:hypothetical protein WJX73_006108 [Symbiochloris irregularis]|uniref:SAP domain-containing protein n=1 Tax=Symbiochloris irregularis TaxID=706552 RepID=A0AAW1NM76_9CHLO
MCRGSCTLRPWPSPCPPSSVTRIVRSAARQQACYCVASVERKQSPAYLLPSGSPYDNLKKAALKEELERRGLKAYGTKKFMRGRLEYSDIEALGFGVDCKRNTNDARRSKDLQALIDTCQKGQFPTPVAARRVLDDAVWPIKANLAHKLPSVSWAEPHRQPHPVDPLQALATRSQFDQTAPISSRTYVGSIDGRKVCVKVAEDDLTKAHLCGEVEVYAELASLQGTIIPRVIEAGPIEPQEPGVGYLATEFVKVPSSS